MIVKVCVQYYRRQKNGLLPFRSVLFYYEKRVTYILYHFAPFRSVCSRPFSPLLVLRTREMQHVRYSASPSKALLQTSTIFAARSIATKTRPELTVVQAVAPVVQNALFMIP